MTQTSQVGLADTSDRPLDKGAYRSARKLAVAVLVAGAACVGSVLLWSGELPARPDVLIPDGFMPFLLLIACATVAEIVYYPVRHGDTFEEQTFFEIVMIIGVLLFEPNPALLCALAGLIAAESFLFRSTVKAVFNVGSYAIATSILVVLYNVLDSGAGRLSLQSIGAILISALAWELINLGLLAWILRIVEGVPTIALLREQMFLTVLMAVTSVGVAMSTVALYPITPVLALFAVLPAFALWYAYKVTGARMEAQDRTRSIAEFSSMLTSAAKPLDLVPAAAEQIRSIFGADDVLVVLDGLVYRSPGSLIHRPIETATPAEISLQRAVRPGDEEAREVAADLLPTGWTSGLSVPLPFRGREPGVLALGAFKPPRGLDRFLPWAKGGRELWRLKTDDRPALASLSASLASALQASESMLALREETAKMTAVVNNASDGIAVFDRAGDVVLWSPAMTNITGVGDTTHPGTASAAVLQVLADQRGRNTGDDGTSLSITRPDGEEREIEVAVVTLDDEAQLSVLTVRDVTHQRRVERMKSDFIATVSHELRTPITPIKGYAQLLSSRWDKMAPDKRVAVLGTIEERANHLSRLVDDLLMASQVSDVESTKLDVALIEADLAALVSKAIAALPALADRITVQGTTTTVTCDRDRAIQCLTNLIGNAGKYSPAQSPIRVEFGPVQGEPWAVVDVIDQGRGIPAAELDKVFDKFYRVEDPMTMTTGGNGLGLFISRELARAMHGDITVESTLGMGSRFALRLPIDGEEAA